MNRRICAVALLTPIFLTPVHAEQSCNRWSTGDTGTGQTMASICTGPAGKQSELEIMCGGTDKLSLRYLPFREQEPEPNSSFKVNWTASGETISLSMDYEADDGALAAYPAISDRVVELLKTAGSIRAGSADGQYGPDEFTLAGSSKAIAAVRKSCP
ncbi:hypothetical protein [Rhizobium herbae]|uniref:Uncharacterized protein n=1 Tax=Rhizobium herbae TaxID=508661 RepID=A0ABS4EGQ6_9HYPH|nr:hypothetical protein [Rhizobium herbae]MBP1857130.1 hypothetical protein [Rhizobium herbae]